MAFLEWRFSNTCGFTQTSRWQRKYSIILFGNHKWDRRVSREIYFYITPAQLIRACCSLAIFNISYATLAQPKIITDNIILRFTHSTWFLLNSRKMISRIYTYTTLNLFQHYHSTLKSYNLILTTIIQLDFRIFYLHNLKSLPTTALFTILVQPLSLD